MTTATTFEHNGLVFEIHTFEVPSGFGFTVWAADIDENCLYTYRSAWPSARLAREAAQGWISRQAA